ncbi:MAG: circadian clock protein KaiC, partial [Methanosarcinales archaeon]|nr:circadian clock protein KaiC [Methanosarcinales archaeon]
MTIKNEILDRVDSGITGYNDLLNGGYFKKTVNVVSGESGTGKTVFGSQFLYHGAQNNEKSLCIMTSESAESLKKEMYSSFKWDFWDMEESGKVTFVDIADPELRLQKTIDMAPMELIMSFKKLLVRKIEEVKPDRVFIDAIEAMLLAIDSPYKLKTLVDDLFGVLR